MMILPRKMIHMKTRLFLLFTEILHNAIPLLPVLGKYRRSFPRSSGINLYMDERKFWELRWPSESLKGDYFLSLPS